MSGASFPLVRVHALVWLVAAAITGCGGSDDPSGPGGAGASGGASGCEPGEAVLDDGSCLPAGVQPNGCAAGELRAGGALLAN